MKLLRVLLMMGGVAMPLAAAADDADRVVVSIKPIHSLVAAVMNGVGEPHLLVEGNQSPHDYAMKPSDAEALQRAKILFWVGPELERFLEKPVDTLAGNAKVVTLEDAHGLTKLKFREGGPFEAHDDHDDHEDHDDHASSEEPHDHDDHAKSEDDHDHDDHAKSEDDHDHDDHAKSEDEHDHDDHAKSEDDHDDHDKAEDDHDTHEEHAHGEIDMHLWLDPANAKAFVHEIEEALTSADPDNASAYKANAEALEQKLDALISELAADLRPVSGRPFVVFHDAYQYFEKRFDLRAVGSITVIPDVMPGAARLREIQDKVEQLGATCVFAEPQFDEKLVGVVTSGTKAKAGVLDPIGASLDGGPDLYFQLIRAMAKSIRSCLTHTH